MIALDARLQVVSCSGPRSTGWARCRTRTLAERRPGRVRLGGLVVTRQHPMTARGTVFLALEDETGHGQRHALAGHLGSGSGRSSAGTRCCSSTATSSARANVVNVIAREVAPLVEAAGPVGGPASPLGVRQIGQAGMRRIG